VDLKFEKPDSNYKYKYIRQLEWGLYGNAYNLALLEYIFKWHAYRTHTERLISGIHLLGWSSLFTTQFESRVYSMI